MMISIEEVVGCLPVFVIKAVSRARWRYPIVHRTLRRVTAQFRSRAGKIQKGVGRGLRFDTANSNAGYLLGTSEPNVQRELERHLKPGMVFYDIGANVGFLSMIAAKLVGENGQVIAFEPVPDHAAAIRRNAHLNEFRQVVVREEALSSDNRVASFLVANDSVTSKLADDRGIDGAPKDIIEVPVRALDSVDGLRAPDVIKIDAEGSEVEVLRGAAELIRRAHPVLLIELHGTNHGVARALRELQYDGAALETKSRLEDAGWNAYVVARPKSHPKDSITAELQEP